MAHFEAEITGENLGLAMLALNRAGIPTISDGYELGASAPSGRSKRRFVGSPSFVILAVIVLAFFAQRLISPAEEAPTYDRFLAQVERQPETIDRVTVNTKTTDLEVDERDGDEYTLGYPPSSEGELIDTLRSRGIEVVVESKGGSVLSLVLYVLPFLIFFVFWLYLMRRMRRQGGREEGPAGRGPSTLKAVVEAESTWAAEALVKRALPADAEYGVKAAERG